MTFQHVLAIPKGTKIGNFTVKGPSVSRGEPALVYIVPNNRGGKPYIKRIRESEWKSAYRYLKKHGAFTLAAFQKTMPDAAKDGECNFRFTIGVFILLGLSGRVVHSSQFRLVPELVPRPLWGRSASRMFGQRAIWKKQIRADALAQADSSCELCGAKSEKFFCHDKWHYDDAKATATLIGFEIHCPECDTVTHFARAVNLGDREEVLRAVLDHLCDVNQCSPESAQSLLQTALEKWSLRNKNNWEIIVSAPLLKRYPELAALPSFVPPPFSQIG
jgi:hypothetical protein